MPVVESHAPPSSWRLSEEGRLQSIVLAEKLKAYGLGCIVASEEPKAAETAKIVAERLGLAWSVAPGLHEHDRTGTAFGTQNEFESVARTFFENPGSLVWGNETAEQARARFTSGVRAVLEEHPGGAWPWLPTARSSRFSSRTTKTSTLTDSGAASAYPLFAPCPCPTSGCGM